MVSTSDRMFKAGEEEEELTVYSRGLNYTHSSVDIWTKVWFLFYLSDRNGTNLSRTAARGSVCTVLFLSYKMNVCISGHRFSLIKSSLTTDKQMVSLGKEGGVVAPSRPARVQGSPLPSLCSLIGSSFWDSSKDSHTVRHCNRRQSLIVSAAADLAAPLQSSAHQYALD